MGATFVNLQVHSRQAETSALLDGVGACLHSVLRKEGYLPAEADQASDRTILVLSRPHWIGVYDELCDEQRQDVAQHLASELSREFETHVVSILMHDSDVLWLELFGSGTPIDGFNNAPDYFGKVSSEERKAARGSPEQWSAVLAPGTPSAALRAVWRKRRLFAEDTLRETADLLGLDPNCALVGFRYLEQGDVELGDAQLLRLGFRHAVRPAHELRAEGPPRLEFNGSSANNVATVGFAKQFGGCSVRNMGGAARGLSVVLSGDALDRELLSISSIQLVASLGEQQTRLVCPTESEGRGEQRLSVASFPDLEIAAGPSYAHHYPSAMSLHAILFGEGLSPGAGVVQVGFVPHGVAEGEAVISLDAEVFAPDRPPLRALEAAQSAPQRPKHVLFARVSMAIEQGEAAAAAAPMIERFCEFLGASAELSVAIFPGETDARSRTSKVKLSSLPHGARWQKVKNELERAACVAGQRKAPIENVFARHPSDGFSFGGTVLRHEFAGDPQLPTLLLWSDLEHVSAERVAAAESLFEAFMADAMLHHSGVQAQVGRVTTVYGWSLDLSEYEAACGIHGTCTLRRSWLSRFLRDVPLGTLWLGESLTGLIPDVSALEAVAQVEPFGRVLKVTIASEGALAGVEHALAPLLPSQADARAATDRLYGRPARDDTTPSPSRM
ncbi:MAG TPA: hypothetical protein VFK05_20990 [Polyangiaceae bacterium]|nr:hypothetical protein [Polyangiaceae bacterium]